MVASILKIVITRNNVCDNLVGFLKSGHTHTHTHTHTHIYIYIYIYIYAKQKHPGCKKGEANQKQQL